MPTFEPHRPTLFVVAGLPGAGKTTLATEIASRQGAVRMSPDDWLVELACDKWNSAMRDRVETLQRSLTAEILSAGASVVIEWGTWGRAKREGLGRIASTCGARTELYVLDPPLETLFERVVRRGQEEPPITRAQLDEWNRSFERVSAAEAATYDVFTVDPQGAGPTEPLSPESD